MQKRTAVVIGILVLPLLAWMVKTPPDFEKYWPQWRGPHATGVAPHGNPPLEWSDSKNIRWKIAIPGKGHSSPIIWGNQIFVTTAVPEDEPAETEPPPSEGDGRGRRGVQPTSVQKFVIIAIKRRDGKILWQRTAREELPHEGTHTDGSWASGSPVTDGEHVVACFGSRGLYCYDMQGNLKWETDPGDMSTRNGFGEGSSPALYRDKIILNWDHEGQDFIIAYDKKTGKQLWKTDRDEITSWATPLVVEHDGKPQVVINATNRVRSYDLATGKLLWESGGMTVNTIPSPVAGNGMVYVTSGFRGSALHAIRLAAAKGDITDSEAIVWKHDRDTPYVPSPLLYGEMIYFLKSNNGILSCFNAKTGQENYSQQRLEGIQGIYASPVGASDPVYFVGRNGVALVIKHGPKFELLAQNTLTDDFEASPAIVENEMYLRGRKYLYCIAEN